MSALAAPIHFDDDLVDIFPDVGTPRPFNAFESIVTWITDSGARTRAKLSPWIKDQVEVSADDSAVRVWINNLDLRIAGYDWIAYECLGSVVHSVFYVGDFQKWRLIERWQEYQETMLTKTGDCEDGAVLLYILLRRAGVPANRLLLFVGEVDDPFNPGARVLHCWLAYRMRNYPASWAFLDWCYNPDKNLPQFWDLYSVNGRTITRFANKGEGFFTEAKTTYHTVWQAFNEDGGFVPAIS